jgi:hypothetical protein
MIQIASNLYFYCIFIFSRYEKKKFHYDNRCFGHWNFRFDNIGIDIKAGKNVMSFGHSCRNKISPSTFQLTSLVMIFLLDTINAQIFMGIFYAEIIFLPLRKNFNVSNPWNLNHHQSNTFSNLRVIFTLIALINRPNENFPSPISVQMKMKKINSVVVMSMSWCDWCQLR